MDTKFQTSFIPKKPILMDQKIQPSHTGGTSIFMFVSIIIFILSVAGAVFSLIWKDILLKQQDNYRAELKKAEERFDVALIEKLKKVNTKIDLSTQLLKKHLSVSEIFAIINSLTAEGIRFSSFDFVGPAGETDSIKISMKGVGNSFSAIAWQSDVFGKSQEFGTNKVIKNPVLTDLVIDEKGFVNFTFTAAIDPKDIYYEKILTATDVESQLVPAATETTTEAQNPQ